MSVIINKEIQNKNGIKIVGITRRMHWDDKEKLQKDMTAIWMDFMSQNTAAKIHHKASDDMYCLYSNYSDASSQDACGFDTTVGYAVEASDEIADGLSLKSLPASRYVVFQVKEGGMDNVGQAWNEIWQLFGEKNEMALDGETVTRTFTGDFELHDKNCTFEKVMCKIFVAIH